MCFRIIAVCRYTGDRFVCGGCGGGVGCTKRLSFIWLLLPSLRLLRVRTLMFDGVEMRHGLMAYIVSFVSSNTLT
jgi:hypothetical protein